MMEICFHDASHQGRRHEVSTWGGRIPTGGGGWIQVSQTKPQNSYFSSGFAHFALETLENLEFSENI